MPEIAMEKCPSCHKENYCMMVLRGQCAWCGYTAQESDIGKPGIWEVKKSEHKL